MDLPKRFSEEQLTQIVEEATIYMCACPAQVAVQVRHLRGLFDYQRACEQEPGNDQAVHQAIAAVACEAHQLMEVCLDHVLTLEGWSREPFKMPEGLRRKRDAMMDIEE